MLIFTAGIKHLLATLKDRDPLIWWSHAPFFSLPIEYQEIYRS